METTTQKNPYLIDIISQIDVPIAERDNDLYGMHGYCTIRYANEFKSTSIFDIYCQIDGDEVRIGHNLDESAALTLVNHANTASHHGEEI